MFLRVAAIYEKNKKGNYEAVNTAAHDKSEIKPCLEIFEKETLPQIINDFTDGGMYVDSTPDSSNQRAEYFIYVQYYEAFDIQIKGEDKKRHVKEHVCVMVTDRKMFKKNGQDENEHWEDIGELQFRHLLRNIHHVHVRGEGLKVTLDMIVKNTLNYIKGEINLIAIKDQLNETKKMMIEQIIPKVTERGEKLEDLERQTAKLADVATLFNKNASDINKAKCCGITVPDIVPNIPYINPAPIPTSLK